ncbi:bifunctional 2-methylcitrate dehydratase/aconitate hydratase [Geomonas sp. RF6]|uniref:bifunctional 2-methylcitrate dehydratase/aconitate hydratase n=1 Tax=Geomonas sp. RF6 TaxID=2897342 RepID=UPI001E564F56|nr:bifunctional 2-methylcitrate dehydratase/aconitate hydratase [Geomonas sp. RF6]UFS70908.1 bifunctional 2-methylcitrate dehydratase/aconitate hydratase [Geomonas sp. RF6]
MINSADADVNLRPEPDREMQDIAEYVLSDAGTPEAYDTARYVLMDSIGCAMLALRFAECRRLLDTVTADAPPSGPVPVPGTDLRLDAVTATLAIGALVRWVDFNDTWLAAEWGHPSDNLAAILSCACQVSRSNRSGRMPMTMGTVLSTMIKAHEIQGIMALENSFNRVGLDHVLLVKLASAAVAAYLLGGTREEIVNTVSQVWVDGQSLRTYRHAPNTGPRKSWAAGDAASRGVRLALLSVAGEPGYPSALSAKGWGFYDASFRGEKFRLPRPYGSYVMENILFKVSFPAEFHAQTAVECAITLHPQVRDRLAEIDRVVIATQQSALRIINKTGPLYNPADRDHCLQYMVAVALIFGDLTADHYRDEIAADPRIDELREKIVVVEELRYSQDYLDPEKRSISNAVQISFKDGDSTDLAEVEYPVGHRRRRQEAFPLLEEKCLANLSSRFPAQRAEEIVALCLDPERLDALPVTEFMEMLVLDRNL